MQWWLTIVSIRFAVICLIVFLLIDCSTIQPQNRHQSRLAGLVWITGAFCSLIHAVATMGLIHQWSHQAAVVDTAERTESMLGISVGVGIYFNYLFVALWLLDAGWLVFFRESYGLRSKWIRRVIYGYLLFIGFNGAVVFVTGWFRWFSGLLFAMLFLVWLRKANQKAGQDPDLPH